MELNREEVLRVLGNIIEPDLKKDIVSLNLIEDLKILEQRIELLIQVSNPALHARKRMQEAVIFNLKRVFGSSLEVDCTIKGMSSESKEKRRKILPDVKYIVAIASGKGGVGKSTITSNLAGGLQKKRI